MNAINAETAVCDELGAMALKVSPAKRPRINWDDGYDPLSELEGIGELFNTLSSVEGAANDLQSSTLAWVVSSLRRVQGDLTDFFDHVREATKEESYIPPGYSGLVCEDALATLVLELSSKWKRGEARMVPGYIDLISTIVNVRSRSYAGLVWKLTHLLEYMEDVTPKAELERQLIQSCLDDAVMFSKMPGMLSLRPDLLKYGAVPKSGDEVAA